MKNHMAGVRLTALGVRLGQWRAGRSSLEEASPWPSSPLGLLLSSRNIPGSRFIRNPAVPVAWPCLGKISALRVTQSQRKASLTRSHSLKQNCVLSFQETNGHIEFWSVSEDIFLFAPRFPEMDNVFISVGRVKKHKIAQQCSAPWELLSKGRHASLHPLLPQVFGTEFWNRNLHKNPCCQPWLLWDAH